VRVIYRLTIRGWLIAVVCLAAGVGCIQEEHEYDVGGSTDQLDRSGERVGAIYTEFRSEPAPGADREAMPRRARVHAQFLDVQGLEAGTALAALEIWQEPSSLDRDTCAISTDGGSASTRPEQERRFRMQLLDVGPLSVRTGGRELTLTPRRIPDLSSAYSGVVYGMDRTLQGAGGPSNATESLTFQPGQPYQFEAPGGSGTSGFEASVTAPAPVDIVGISRRSASERLGRLSTKTPVRIEWDTQQSSQSSVGSETADGRDGGEVFLTVTGARSGAPLRCRLKDDGRFTLPAELVDEVAGEAERLTFVMRRVESRDIDVGGLDEMRMTISATDVRRRSIDAFRR